MGLEVEATLHAQGSQGQGQSIRLVRQSRLISAGLPDARAVLDGEICSLDKKGRPHFKNLLFHRGNYSCFLAFDLLMLDGKDCRRESLLDRKLELRRLPNRCGSEARIQYFDYVNGAGIPLFEQVCRLDLEGIVAKQKYAPYVTDREQSTWFKIRNRKAVTVWKKQGDGAWKAIVDISNTDSPPPEHKPSRTNHDQKP